MQENVKKQMLENALAIFVSTNVMVWISYPCRRRVLWLFVSPPKAGGVDF